MSHHVEWIRARSEVLRHRYYDPNESPDQVIAECGKAYVADVTALLAQLDAMTEYAHFLAHGLSDAEARATVWPDTPEGDFPEVGVFEAMGLPPVQMPETLISNAQVEGDIDA